MNLDRVFNIMAAIVTVALVTTIVAHPQTANVIRAIAGGFSESINAAKS